jgi:hypothetical protein
MTAVALPTTTLSNGSIVISKFSVAPTGGNISWHSLFWEGTKDGATGIANLTVWDVTGGGNTQVAGTAVITGNVNGAGVCDSTGADDTSCTMLFTATSEQQISVTKTYELRADITATVADTSFVTTKLAQDATFAAPNEAVSGSDVRDGDADVTIVWSDLSAASHDTTTTDWNNDFGVKNLPISQTLTR